MKMNQFREVLKEMTAPEAIQVFVKAGFDPRGKTPDEIKRAYRKIIFKNHPDRGGDEALAKQINQAYGMIKDGIQNTTPGSGRAGYERSAASKKAWDDFWAAADARREAQNREREREAAETDTRWVWAGHSGGMRDNAEIYRKDYTDRNFIKKTMWEKSGKSNEEWTLWGYDGAFFRNTLTVYGSKHIFKDMAEAMVTWQTKGGNPYRCRAVFVMPRFNQLKKNNELFLIWADGVDYSKNPIPFHHDSFNANPGNDQSFMRELPGRLDKVKAHDMMKNVGGRGIKEDHRV